jgi:hypothetical protein
VKFARWLRTISEQQLMVAAERKMAAKYGLPEPPRPRGVNIFWQRVYAPAFYLIPYPLRSRIAGALPGSHRRTWTPQTPPRGPAV